jgi:hypothetical protein
MSRVVAFVACGFTLAACSGTVPGLDFLKSSPPTAALRFESVPAGAEVKVAGQNCRTPCELTLPVADVSATFALKGYQRQTIAVHSEGGGVFSTAQFAPNPVHADLQRGVASAQPRTRSKTAAAKPRANSAEAHDPSDVPEETLLPSYANAR